MTRALKATLDQLLSFSIQRKLTLEERTRLEAIRIKLGLKPEDILDKVDKMNVALLQIKR